jgi:mRNA interferase HigB
MRIIKPSTIRKACEQNPEWEASLVSWIKIVKNADWGNSADVKQSWSNCCVVGKYFRFEICHNRCRLMTEINFRTKLVFIRGVMSHAEYDRKNWEED